VQVARGTKEGGRSRGTQANENTTRIDQIEARFERQFLELVSEREKDRAEKLQARD